ncbi:hypothetical protein NDU88_009774 [Pleurodeles waltl]|uniref:Uncharacterized protein n=1 Tax=Pleurodeles waltl TaxID=8319 RepID=A0AAV7QSI8_PLEWA|nr:hypothetical protein NDU88_009774 [Pleurodeles waltl]
MTVRKQHKKCTLGGAWSGVEENGRLRKDLCAPAKLANRGSPPCVPDPRYGPPAGGERGPPEGRSCLTRATAAASGDAGVSASSGLQWSHGLRCGAAQARGASRGRRPDWPSTASAPRVLERNATPSCGGGRGDPGEGGPQRNLGLKTTTTTTAEQKSTGKEALSHED